MPDNQGFVAKREAMAEGRAEKVWQRRKRLMQIFDGPPYDAEPTSREQRKALYFEARNNPEMLRAWLEDGRARYPVSSDRWPRVVVEEWSDYEEEYMGEHGG